MLTQTSLRESAQTAAGIKIIPLNNEYVDQDTKSLPKCSESAKSLPKRQQTAKINTISEGFESHEIEDTISKKLESANHSANEDQQKSKIPNKTELMKLKTYGEVRTSFKKFKEEEAVES